MIIERFKESDLQEIITLFYETIHSVNIKDYTEEQVNIWAPKTPNLSRWMPSLKQHITYVVKIGDKIIGFGDLEKNGYLDRLFIHKDFQGKGAASLILSTLEKEALSLGLKEIITQVSITAKPFFESKGYIIVNKQKKEHHGIVFINYLMKKELS